jgi:hypothetical protein
VHARQRADDFKMAQFLGTDVHQEILAVRILAIEPLNRILHRGRQLAIGASELFKEHIAKARVWFVDANSEHQFLHVVIHWWPRRFGMMSPERPALCFVPKLTCGGIACAPARSELPFSGRGGREYQRLAVVGGSLQT